MSLARVLSPSTTAADRRTFTRWSETPEPPTKLTSIVACALALAACGTRSYVNIASASATRDADQHVTLTAIVECQSSRTGDDCKHPEGGPTSERFCVTGSWSPLADAGPIDVVQVCDSAALATGSKTATVVLRSNVTIPQDAGITLSVGVDGNYAIDGTYGLTRLTCP